MNETGHQFRRYVRRMVGRRIRFQALCECGWWSTSSDEESKAWADYCQHSEQAAQEIAP